MEDSMVCRAVDMLEQKVMRREMWKTMVESPLTDSTVERWIAELTIEIDLLKTLLKGADKEC